MKTAKKVIDSMTVNSEALPIMAINRTPIPAKKCNWDVPLNYLDKGPRDGKWKGNNPKLNYLQKLPTPGVTNRKILAVTVNGYEMTFTIGKGNEYFNTIHDGKPGKQGLTDYLQALSKGTGNKITIK